MPSTPSDQVRLLIADTDTNNELFTDQQIDAFLDLEDQNVRLAAASALETIATSEVLVSKKIRTQDLQTDGPAVAAELRAQAEHLRALDAQADQEEIFDVIPPAHGCRPELTEPEVWGL